VLTHLSEANRLRAGSEGELASYAANVDHAFSVDEDEDDAFWLDAVPAIDGGKLF
jgi:quercetin dioxygenase-like cupin family protein